MYDRLPDDIRNGHPYFMYDEIHAQPEAVAESIRLAEEHGVAAVHALARARRVFVTGSGTSMHAAEAGAWMLRLFSKGTIDARAIPAFEFASYLPGLRPDDVLVAFSHSGGTHSAVRALERARRTGMDAILVTGFPDATAAKLATVVLPTGFPRERSWAHTASYTAALTSMAVVANNLAAPSERLDLGPLPDVVREALQLEEMARRLAAGVVFAETEAGSASFVCIGGGPNEVTAREAVLKVVETSYLPAVAYELEGSLHGPLAGVGATTLVVVVAPPGPSSDRAAELARAVAALGTTPVVLLAEENAPQFEEAHGLLLPSGVPEVLSPIAAIVPLQLFSYFLAVGKGVNPDLIHRHDERYRAARGEYT